MVLVVFKVRQELLLLEVVGDQGEQAVLVQMLHRLVFVVLLLVIITQVWAAPMEAVALAPTCCRQEELVKLVQFVSFGLVVQDHFHQHVRRTNNESFY